MRIYLPALFLTLVMAQPTLAAQLPDTEMDNLADETVHLPADFQGNPVLVILAFAHEQREEAGRVMALLQKAHEANNALGWYELPIIDAPGIAHYVIKNGMRGKTDEALHSHIVPQFVDEDDWRKSTGITTTEPILAKVNHEGEILKTVPLREIKSEADIAKF
jgi:hypothetical protein